MLRVLLMLCVAMLAGCGTVLTVGIDTHPRDAVGFQFVDERPYEERLSSQARSAAGENTQFGDDAVKPDGPTLLKTWLHDKVADGVAGKKVVLTRFFVNVFEPAVNIDPQHMQNAMNSSPNISIVGAIVAGFMIQGIESAKNEKMITVIINGKVDGRDFATSAGDRVRGRVSEGDIRKVIVQALDAAMGEVKHALEPVPPERAITDAHVIPWRRACQAYSSRMPASRMTLPMRAISDWMRAPNCSGELATISTTALKSRSFTSPRFSTRTIS